MGWRDRAKVVSAAPPLDTSTPVREPGGAVAPVAGGNWRDRATSVEPSPPESSTDDAPSGAESFARGAGQGLTLGFGDEISAGIDAGAQKFGLSGDNSDRPLGELYRQSRESFRRDNEAAEKANPKLSMAGNLAGNLLGSTLIPTLKAAKGAGTLAKLGYHGLNAAIQGGANAGGTSEADLTQGDAKGFGRDVGTGAAVSGVLAPAMTVGGQLVGKGLSKVSAPISDAVRGWAEKRAGSVVIPMLRDLRAQVGRSGAEEADQALKGIGRKALDTGAVGFGDNFGDVAKKLGPMRDEAGKAVGDAIERLDLATKGDWAVDGRKVAARIQQEVMGPLSSAPINRGIVKRIALEAQGLAGKGPMSFEDAEAVKRAIDKHINYFSQAKNPMADALRAVRYVLSDETEKQAARVDPRLADEFLSAKEHFGFVAPAEDAATDRYLRDLANRKVSPSDYAAMIAGAAHGGPGAMLAAAGHHVLRTRGASSLAVTADGLANLLKSAPEKLGQYAPTLARAAARSPQLLEAIGNLLIRKDPHFAATIKAAQQ